MNWAAAIGALGGAATGFVQGRELRDEAMERKRKRDAQDQVTAAFAPAEDVAIPHPEDVPVAGMDPGLVTPNNSTAQSFPVGAGPATPPGAGMAPQGAARQPSPMQVTQAVQGAQQGDPLAAIAGLAAVNNDTTALLKLQDERRRQNLARSTQQRYQEALENPEYLAQVRTQINRSHPLLTVSDGPGGRYILSVVGPDGNSVAVPVTDRDLAMLYAYEPYIWENPEMYQKMANSIDERIGSVFARWNDAEIAASNSYNTALSAQELNQYRQGTLANARANASLRQQELEARQWSAPALFQTPDGNVVMGRMNSRTGQIETLDTGGMMPHTPPAPISDKDLMGALEHFSLQNPPIGATADGQAVNFNDLPPERQTALVQRYLRAPADTGPTGISSDEVDRTRGVIQSQSSGNSSAQRAGTGMQPPRSSVFTGLSPAADAASREAERLIREIQAKEANPPRGRPDSAARAQHQAEINRLRRELDVLRQSSDALFQDEALNEPFLQYQFRR